ncbi:MAG TPA: hypothetical protein VHB97_02250 [Polyangia bacterium]|nr:hypothetical protein [Polyangia bacterium]
MTHSTLGRWTFLAVLAAAGSAQAQTMCDDTIGTHRVFILAADTQVPALNALGAKLKTLPTPITLVYTPAGSCANIADLYTNTWVTNAAGGGTFYIPDGFDPTTTPTAPTCTVPAGTKPDMAISIVFPDLTDCPTSGTMPSTITATQGPVQAMLFAVPGGVGATTGSTQQTITAEEAYLIMGLGATGSQTPPWNDPQYIYGRTASKGTQVSIGANIGVAAAKWKLLADPQHEIDQSTGVATALANLLPTSNAVQGLGILGVEIYDSGTNRSQMHALAYRAYGQYHSYWPDSTPTGFDKQNVRDGHYPLWSYVQYLAPQAAAPMTGAANPDAQTVIDYFTDSVTAPPFEPLDVIIGNHLVPECAMKVTRSVEGGAESAYSSSAPCDCYFDFVVSGATTCAACSDTMACATGTCRHGYCEAK